MKRFGVVEANRMGPSDELAPGRGPYAAAIEPPEPAEEEMTSHRVFRANRKSPAERAREKAVRERLEKERPLLDDLVRSGDCDPDAIMTMGMYFDIQRALQALKRDRQRGGLSIGDVAERSGLDRAVVSRLENGKQDNPTVATLMRYAAAIGKRFLWTYEEVADGHAVVNGKAGRRRTTRRN